MNGRGENESSLTLAERAPPGLDVHVGATVDKYTIIRMLGKGGMGAVYEARHARLSRRFAIKFLLPAVAANPDILRRFENEAKAAGGLEHPNLAAVTDFGRTADGAPYMVMEFLQGRDCGRLLRETGPLPVGRACNIVLQACRGLAVAHEAKIIHRDLKPENLFLTDAGDGNDLIKVLDFGIAKLRVSDASIATGTGQTFGTAHYMSPEQARGAGEVDERSDVWSLGVVLYELLSGVRPFQGEQFLQVIYQILSVEPEPLGNVAPGLPADVLAIVARALTKDIEQRTPSVRALAQALAPFAGVRVTGPEHVRAPAAMGTTMLTPPTGLGIPVAGLAGGSAGVSGRGAGRSGAAIAPDSAGGPGRSPSRPGLGGPPSELGSFTVRPPAAPSKAPSSGKRAWGFVVVAVAIAAAAAGVVAMRRQKATSDSPEPAASVPAARPPIAPLVAPAALPPVVEAPNAAAPPATVGAPRPASSDTERARPLAPEPAVVRTVSEHSTHGSNRRVAHRQAVQAAPEIPAPAPVSAPHVEPARENSPSKHRIDILKDNPY